MGRFSERLIRNPAAFERFLLETLPDLQPDEAFVFVVPFRRKERPSKNTGSVTLV